MNDETDSKEANAKRAAYAANPEKYILRVKAWRKANLEKAKAAARARYAANPEKARADRAKYRARHREELLAKVKEWARANPEKTSKNKKRWAQSNREKDRQAKRNWKRDNPLKVKLHCHARRARKKNARGECSELQWKARLYYYGSRCVYCVNGAYEHIDHVIPLSKGGTNWPANLRPACQKCNLSKKRQICLYVEKWSIRTTLKNN